MQCPTPINIADPRAQHPSVRLEVPCGKCGACRQNRRSDWSFRLKQEQKQSITSYFITFTYDEQNLRYYHRPDENGELHPTLRKQDLQNFLKRLRKEQSKLTDRKIRYYAVGEYGTETNRPHYHAIIFNLLYALTEKLERIWGLGHVYSGDLNDASIHYVTKYHVNFVKDQDDPWAPEFATMSRNPGIGKNYVDNNKKWHKQNQYPFVMNNGYRQRLPRYYADKIWNPWEKQIITAKTKMTMLENYEHEIQRLKKLGKQDPENYIFTSLIQSAQKQKRKSQENNTF